ncbi:MAG TPA: hypothetical protein VNI01_08640, partial [Elusimicrobiota bacterium]|nr:hypothetical protein [Elusimicrobiota bacterium]
NEWRASGRRYETDRDGAFGILPEQESLSLDNSELARAGAWRAAPGNTTPQASFTQGNQIDFVHDYGFEAGGPIVKDRLWIWGSYGRNKIQLRTIANVVDFTDLKAKNAKINAQVASNNSASGFYFDSDKVKIGRNAGPTRTQETTWDQGHFGPKPTTYKVEDTHIFSSNFYLTGMYSKVNGGFELVPEGDLSRTVTLDNAGVWHNSFLLNTTLRPQKNYKADASNFFNTGSLSHELKFGAGYRTAEVSSVTQWGGQGYVLDGPTNFGLPAGINFLAAARNGAADVENKYQSAYVQDTLTVGNITANIGLRYDKQTGQNHPTSVGPNPTFAAELPGVGVGSFDSGFDWTNITPRLGITYALGAERKTLLRASYSRFADQLGAATANWTNPLRGPGYAYFLTTQPVAAGNDGFVSPGEILGGIGFSANVNPVTGGLLNSNGVDSDLSAPISDELLLGVEHALLPEFVVGLNLTYRKYTNVLEQELLVFDGSTDACEDAGDPLQCPAFQAGNLGSLGRQHQRSDYEAVTFNQALPDGSTRPITWYELRPGVSTRGGGFLTNGDREQEYKGAALTFNKRLANRWMLRGNFTWADWTWSKVPSSELENPTETLNGGTHEGDVVMQGSGTGSGSKGGIYINSKWSYSVNGLYQIAPDRPWGFNVAANLTGREGYPIPYWRRRGGGLARENFGLTSVSVVSDPDEFRFDDIHMVDARVEKEFSFSDFGLTLGVDVFNVFNESYVLQRNHRLAQSSSNNVREITSPRIYRLGLRVSFR